MWYFGQIPYIAIDPPTLFPSGQRIKSATSL